MILDVFPSYKDKDIVEALNQFERATGSSLKLIVEKHLEKLLYSEGYFTLEVDEEKIPENNVSEEIEKKQSFQFLHHTKGGKWQVVKSIGNIKYHFGTYSEIGDAIKVRNFLISKNWDVYYSIKNIGFKGERYRKWIFSEIEKRDLEEIG